MIDLHDVSKVYQIGEERVHALDHVTLHIYPKEFVSVIGPSGSGKSTLMNIIGCLDAADAGTYRLDGIPIEDYGEKQLARVRNEKIGFIFQNSQMMARLDAMKNVELPLIYAGVRPRERVRRAEEMLVKVGLRDRLHHTPNQLSGGQQQRVAIARALVTRPSILLADEPTGALDQHTGHQIMDLFEELHEEGNTILMITHDLSVAKHARRVVHIIDGELTEAEEATFA